MADATINVSDLQEAAKRCLGYRKTGIFAMWSIEPIGLRLYAYYHEVKTDRVIDWNSAVQIQSLPVLMRQMEMRAIGDLTGDQNMCN